MRMGHVASSTFHPPNLPLSRALVPNGTTTVPRRFVNNVGRQEKVVSVRRFGHEQVLGKEGFNVTALVRRGALRSRRGRVGCSF